MFTFLLFVVRVCCFCLLFVCVVSVFCSCVLFLFVVCVYTKKKEEYYYSGINPVEFRGHSKTSIINLL